MFKKMSAFVLALALIVAAIPFSSAVSAVKAENIAESREFYGSYSEYIEKNSALPLAQETIVIDANKNYTTNMEITSQQIDGKDFVVTADAGYIEWTFNVKTAAIYHIAAVWANVSGKGLDIMRTVKLDGKVPFDGMNSIYFRRTWKNTGEVYIDNSGNEYSKKQTEELTVRASDFYSLTDYTAGGYNIALTAGQHTIRFESIQEPMALNSIVLSKAENKITYTDVKEDYSKNGYKAVDKNIAPIIVEAENSKYTSKSTLRPVADKSSPAVSPYDTIVKKLNTVGGEGWNEAAQWVEWNFTVKRSGLYKVAFHAKQNYKSGFSSSRRLLIDGKSPFKEADYIEFEYGLNWQNISLNNGKEDCLVYLEKGQHTLSMEVSVTEEMSDIINKSTRLQDTLISIYRQIIMVTGTMPDSLRDYNLFSTIDNCEETFEDILDELKEIVKRLEKLGYSGSETSSMNRLIIQIKDFLKDDNTIPERLDSFNSNIMTFSTWITSAMQQPLLLDYIWIGSPDTELPKAESGFFKKIIDECYRLFISFVKDYDVIASVGGKDNKTINLWVGLGIDQSIVLKSLIDSSFTPNWNVNVDIELVNMGVLLRAVAAGVGPDIALFQGQDIPVEYAMRGAVYNLKNFKDLDEVLERFYPSSYESFKYQGGIYALPETQTFSMMFYRTDILDELEVSVPNTWNDLYAVLAKLQTNNLSISLPSPFVGGSGSTGLNQIYMMMLYQKNGALYTKDGKYSAMNTENAISAFTQWVNLYTKYKVPQTTNTLTRFRMGESPLVIANYTFYNELQIGAPEIEGKWNIAPVPATVGEDGGLNRSQASGVTSCLIFSNSKEKEASWKFLKWWTSAETQADYGIEIEALQGPSARWATANTEAFKNLPWAARISKIIEEQWQNVKGVPQIAGGYYTPRSLDNAIRSVVNENENTRETILDFATDIDEEITVKRKEFGLEVDTEE
ncbi:MAG: extracellular solute-binding protein [Clostridia bacterium]|nr:extracellular solute-binding protein [Clostridia bacterium]